MAIYSKTLCDEQILALIPEQSHHVLIVACGGCVNESLAYDHETPIVVLDVDGTEIPQASLIEAQRISKMLIYKGYETEIKLLNGDLPVLCIFSDEREEILPPNRLDVILTLSCISGSIGLRTLTNVPVFSITKQAGYLSYTYAKDKEGNKIMIKERSQITGLDGQNRHLLHMLYIVLSPHSGFCN